MINSFVVYNKRLKKDEMDILVEWENYVLSKTFGYTPKEIKEMSLFDRKYRLMFIEAEVLAKNKAIEDAKLKNKAHR